MTKESERELLELAAKAAGIPVRWNDNPPCTVMIDDIGDAGWWSPLTNDGDNRRLQVKLNLGLVPVDEGGWACITWDHDEEVTLAFDFDPNRAITRAAAEIGRQMP